MYPCKGKGAETRKRRQAIALSLTQALCNGSRATRDTWFERATLSCRAKCATSPCEGVRPRTKRKVTQINQCRDDTQYLGISTMSRVNAWQLEAVNKMINNELAGSCAEPDLSFVPCIKGNKVHLV